MMGIACIAWDFDGVLNDSIRDGRFLWADTVSEDIGHNIEAFLDDLFKTDFAEVVTDKVDLLDLVEVWAKREGYAPGAAHFLDYWFRKDALADPEMLRIMDEVAAIGIRQVIATNNERRRSDYIEHQMGFGNRTERLFSSGRLGVAKPDPAFFRCIEEALDLSGEQLLLVDDTPKNVEAARTLGWQGHHHARGDYFGLRRVLGLAV